jgi:hypothetical protein
MMMITVFGIVARAIGFGSFEPVIALTTMGVLVVASSGLAITTIKGGHFIIDLFTRNNNGATNQRFDAFWLVVMTGMLGMMAYCAFHDGMTLDSYGTRTAILKWSVLASYIPPIFGWAIAAVVALSIAGSVFLRQK